MDIETFSQKMIELMPQCIRGFSRHEHNCLSRGEITLPQLWTLEYLSKKGEILMSELADSLEISRPAATGLVERLVNQGFVLRTNDDEDRRTVKVRISAKGKKIVANIWNQKRRNLIEAFSRISPRDRAQHLRNLEQVVKYLAEKPRTSKINKN